MAKDSGHWYTRAGKPCHTVPNKSRPGTHRPVKLSDARKLGLFPSVTGILDVLGKPQLDRWKLMQMSAAFQRRIQRLMDPHDPMSAIEILRELKTWATMDEDQFHSQLDTEAFQQVKDAQDAGSQIHKAMEKVFEGHEVDMKAPVYLPALNESFPMKTFINPLREIIEENEIHVTGSEKTFACTRYGYGGTIDCTMTSKRGKGIGDFKSRKTKPGYEVKPYDTQPMQIGAYHQSVYGAPTRDETLAGWNLYFSTTEPGRVDITWYTPAELERYWVRFFHCLNIWQDIEEYNPIA